ncbi:ribonuclease P protein component [Mongoliibacter ruber]|uniref:Ribonuclease P protein component n=1 Tax=Mongoliibacter ruber TaxID=1750599 RepID=A0A2T0WCJ4_9BACT|nr:ribonuclease P protein component [Mongoliibacter ruber]PRY84376.1 ribonuclease P protein component [Mongoliibacter ruber]
MNYKLTKNERLHSEKLIKELFNKGSSFFLHPFKVLVLDLPVEDNGTVQVLFSVSKKKIKKAVNRNFIKRRMKEAYRLNKNQLQNISANNKLIGLIYVSAEVDTFQNIQKRVLKVIDRINSITDKQNPLP